MTKLQSVGVPHGKLADRRRRPSPVMHRIHPNGLPPTPTRCRPSPTALQAVWKSQRCVRTPAGACCLNAP